MKNNCVAKYARKYNKAVVFKDKKKALKRGDAKHPKNTVITMIESKQIAA
jgi:hypothetical protein